MAKSLSIYKTPELRFIPDRMFDKAHEMDVKIQEALSRKPITLKDVYGKNYKTPEEKEKAKALRAEKKKTTSSPKKKTIKKSTPSKE